MTPSLGVTPDEAQLPAGPQPTGVAIFGQFPVLWAGLSGEQIWGLGLPEEWVLGLDLSLGGPLTPLSSSPIAVNISTKWKRKKKKTKKKSKKISSLEATGHLQPRPARTFSGTEPRPALATRTSCMCTSQPGWAAARAAFTLQRQNQSRSNSKTKNLSFPAPVHHLCSGRPPGARTSLPAPGPEACLPLPRWPGDTLTPKDAFAKMAALPL